MKYHFGIPGFLIWITHIIIGIFLAYVGYKIVFNKRINNNIGLLLLVVGVMAAIYHGHIWYYHVSNDHLHDDESIN